MPSQINNGNNITNIAANYLVAQPSTQFGTRQLSVLNIAKTGIETDYALSDSVFSKVVRALQQTAEVWAVFTPVNDTTDSVNVIIATDTQYVGDTETSRTAIPSGGLQPAADFGILEAALNAGAGTTGIVVTVPAGFVAPFHG